MQIFRATIIVTYFFFCFLITTRQGLFSGSIFAIAGLLAYIPIRRWMDKWEHRELLKEYATMIYNRVVYSDYYGDREVIGRALEEEALLEESGNNEYRQGNLKVHVFIYRKHLTEKEHILDLSASEADEKEFDEDDFKLSKHKAIKIHLVQCPSYDRFIILVKAWQEEDNARQEKNIALKNGSWFVRHAV